MRGQQKSMTWLRGLFVSKQQQQAAPVRYKADIARLWILAGADVIRCIPVRFGLQPASSLVIVRRILHWQHFSSFPRVRVRAVRVRGRAGIVYIGHKQRGGGSQVLLLLASAHSHPHLALPALRPFDTGKDFEKFKYVLSFGPSAKEFQFWWVLG